MLTKAPGFRFVRLYIDRADETTPQFRIGRAGTQCGFDKTVPTEVALGRHRDLADLLATGEIAHIRIRLPAFGLQADQPRQVLIQLAIFGQTNQGIKSLRTA